MYRPKCRGARRRTLGQSLAEFAIILPLLAFILLLAIDFGRIYQQWITLNNVAKIGANYAAQHPEGWDGTGSATVVTAYRSLMAKDLTSTNCVVNPVPDPTFPDPAPNTYSVGGHAKVALSCNFGLITPIFNNLFPGQSLAVSASALFTIRGGAINGIPVGNVNPPPTATPTPTPAPTATPTPTPTATAGATATPTPTPLPAVNVSFYGVPRPPNSQGGGPPGSPGENQIIGIPGLIVDFTNTTTGNKVACLWNFGDGSTSTSCGSPISHTYSSSTRRTYDVTLTVNGSQVTRTMYVLVGCQVPSFTGVRVNNASGVWTSAGFAAANLTTASGNGNYFINTQSLAGGLLNPNGGCTGATITVGP
jgi:TadE-like protein/PKD domain